MQHPLDFIPDKSRKPIFIALLIWTLGLFAVFRVLDQPLAPNGIVSFELARTAERASAILASWSALAKLYAAFGLGLDYLFMPSYAVTISLGVLLAMRRHDGLFVFIGKWIGWGSLIAALFDAAENFALWKSLTQGVNDLWPQVAFGCASFKFGLILIGIGFTLMGWIMPKSK
jgi:hypothetical protein